MKSGIQTTEFWVTAVGMVLTLLKTTCCPDIPTEAFLGLVPAVAYILGRSWVKSNASPTA